MAEGLEELRAGLEVIAKVGGSDSHRLMAVGRCQEEAASEDIVGGLRHQARIAAHYLRRFRQGISDEAAVPLAERMKPVLEGGDDAEVAATTAEAQKEVGVLALARVE